MIVFVRLVLLIACSCIIAAGVIFGSVVVAGETDSFESGVLIDFFPGNKIRPRETPYRVVVTDLSETPPSIRSDDPSGDVPGISGSFVAGENRGSITLTIDGRSDDVSGWNADKWSGGTSRPVIGSESGLGIRDAQGGNKVDGGEAIIWSFDLRSLSLEPDESLVMTTVDFGGNEEGKKARLWRRIGQGTDGDSAKHLGTGGRWTGKLVIAEGDEFAISGNGRLRSMTMKIETPNGMTQPAARAEIELKSNKEYDASVRNIIMILADDMAWYDTPVRMDEQLENSAQEIMRSLRDPQDPGRLYKWNLQKLAEQGTVFRNAYSGAPQCTPTRACLQTGMTTARHRLSVELGGKGIGEFNEKPELSKFPVKPSGVRKPFPDDMTTIPEALAPLGYRCAHYGKWHLESDPAVEGYVDSDGDTDNDGGKTYDPKDPRIPVDLPNPKRIKELTDKAIAFMTKQKQAAVPFYIQLSHYAVHAPWECKRSSRALFQHHPDVVAYNKGQTDPDKINRKNDPAVFFGMIYELDQSIGRLLREIDQLGLTDQTLVIFKSDNGYRRFDTQNFAQPFYGRKWFLWQAGLRVPMIVKGPEVAAGRVSKTNVTTYDLLPTFYDWAGGDPATLDSIDGVSLKAILRGESPTETFVNRSLYFHYPHYRSAVPLSVVVKGNHKLVYSWDATIRTDISVSDPRMLFDLASDPGEFHNITGRYPEIAASLWNDLDCYLTTVDARRPKENSAAYLADAGKQFEADDSAERRDTFPPFEGSRNPSRELNDAPPR